MGCKGEQNGFIPEAIKNFLRNVTIANVTKKIQVVTEKQSTKNKRHKLHRNSEQNVIITNGKTCVLEHSWKVENKIL